MHSLRFLLLSAILAVSALPAAARETAAPLRTSPAPQATQPPSDGAEASPPPKDPSDSSHRGFFVRSELGGGYRSMSSELEGQKLRVDGAGLGASVLIGGTPAPNLILLGELSVSSIISPTLRVGNETADLEDASAALVGLGPGVIYYFMPANISVGGSLLLTRLTVSQDNEIIGRSDWGFGGVFRIAKEWQVGRSGALGLSGQGCLASMKDQGEGAPTWFATAFTLAASFSYD